MVTSTFMDAIHVAKENERIASDNYARAAQNLVNPLARELFVQLSGFETYHLEMLTALEKSLQDSGEFIQYEGKEFPRPPVFDIKAAAEPDKKSAMQVMTEAKALEKEMEKAYTSLAEQAPAGVGKDMFTRLSGEEHQHYVILSEAWWSMNDTGKWKWTVP